MGKTYVRLCYRHKTYNIDPKDIRKVYKSLRSKAPRIPNFDENDLFFNLKLT